MKWRNRPVSIKDILDFVNTVEQSGFAVRKRKLFVISKSGFDNKALLMAKKYKVVCLDKNIEEMTK